jgi:subtilisin family serine protease
MRHGTHVAGIAAAVKNNEGIHGVAYNAKILSINVIEGTTVAAGDDGAGIVHAAAGGAKVVNMSWGVGGGINGDQLKYVTIGDTEYLSEKASISDSLTAATANDILLTVAAGNDGNVDFVGIPAVFATDADLGGNMLTVGAVDFDGNIASFSNHCKQVKDKCLVAPGVGIYSSVPTDSYDSFNRTSMAAPHVAGAAAVLRSAWPALTAAQTAQILLDSATDLGAAGVEDIYGHGMLNLLAAVKTEGGTIPALFKH